MGKTKEEHWSGMKSNSLILSRQAIGSHFEPECGARRSPDNWASLRDMSNSLEIERDSRRVDPNKSPNCTQDEWRL